MNWLSADCPCSCVQAGQPAGWAADALKPGRWRPRWSFGSVIRYGRIQGTLAEERCTTSSAWFRVASTWPWLQAACRRCTGRASSTAPGEAGRPLSRPLPCGGALTIQRWSRHCWRAFPRWAGSETEAQHPDLIAVGRHRLNTHLDEGVGRTPQLGDQQQQRDSLCQTRLPDYISGFT